MYKYKYTYLDFNSLCWDSKPDLKHPPSTVLLNNPLTSLRAASRRSYAVYGTRYFHVRIIVGLRETMIDITPLIKAITRQAKLKVFMVGNKGCVVVIKDEVVAIPSLSSVDIYTSIYIP
jgi:hypothetical protein